MKGFCPQKRNKAFNLKRKCWVKKKHQSCDIMYDVSVTGSQKMTIWSQLKFSETNKSYQCCSSFISWSLNQAWLVSFSGFFVSPPFMPFHYDVEAAEPVRRVSSFDVSGRRLLIRVWRFNLSISHFNTSLNQLQPSTFRWVCRSREWIMAEGQRCAVALVLD